MTYTLIWRNEARHAAGRLSAPVPTLPGSRWAA
jgi:hypothetical protein